MLYSKEIFTSPLHQGYKLFFVKFSPCFYFLNIIPHLPLSSFALTNSLLQTLYLLVQGSYLNVFAGILIRYIFDLYGQLLNRILLVIAAVFELFNLIGQLLVLLGQFVDLEFILELTFLEDRLHIFLSLLSLSLSSFRFHLQLGEIAFQFMVLPHEISVHLPVLFVCFHLRLLAFEPGLLKHSFSLPVLCDHTLEQLILSTS